LSHEPIGHSGWPRPSGRICLSRLVRSAPRADRGGYRRAIFRRAASSALDTNIHDQCIAFPGTADYAASKAGVVGYTKGAARDLGRRNITVNVVLAGIIETDMATASKDKLLSIIMASHAIRRFAEVEAVAATIVFLVGSDASFITGVVIGVNGRFTA